MKTWIKSLFVCGLLLFASSAEANRTVYGLGARGGQFAPLTMKISKDKIKSKEGRQLFDMFIVDRQITGKGPTRVVTYKVGETWTPNDGVRRIIKVGQRKITTQWRNATELDGVYDRTKVFEGIHK